MPKYLKQIRSELIEEQQTSNVFKSVNFWFAFIVLSTMLIAPFTYWVKLQEDTVRKELILEAKSTLQAKINASSSIFTNFSRVLYTLGSMPEIKESLANKTPIDQNSQDFLSTFLKTFQRIESISFIDADGMQTFLLYKELNNILVAPQNTLQISEHSELIDSFKVGRPNYIHISPFYFEKRFNSDGKIRPYYVISMPLFKENAFVGLVQLKIYITFAYTGTSKTSYNKVQYQNMDIYNGDWLINERYPDRSLVSGRTQTGTNVSQDMPDFWQIIRLQKTGVYHTNEGLYVFESILPFSAKDNEEWRFAPSMYNKFNFTFVGFIGQEALQHNLPPWLYWTIIIVLFGIAAGLSNVFTTRRYSKLSINLKNQQLNDLLGLNDAIIDNLGAALITIDKHGTITRFSNHAETMFGYNADEVEGSNVKILMRADIAAKHDEYLGNYVKDTNAGMTKNQSILGQTRVLIAKGKNGNEFPVEIVVTKVPFGDTYRFAGLITDISERLKLEEALQKAVDKANVANESKSKFLAHMSHEIRTPLNAIYGTVQLLRKTLVNSEHHNLIEKATYSCKSLLNIINDILDISKIEANKIDLENIPFNFLGVLNEAINDIEDVAHLKGIEIEIVGRENFEDGWLGDPTRLKQVLLNLCSNAVKFTQQGKISIAIRNQPNGDLFFSVQDTGIGMNEEQLSRLFMPFEQANKSTTRLYGGTGLGMSICSKFVELMQGKLNVASQMDIGTTFEVTLPLPKSSVRIENDLLHAADIDLSGRKILLIEDNVINQTVFQAMLNDTKATLEIASDGIEALEILRTYNPEMIFMDIQMPRLDGVETCKQIKSENPLVPIVALTANILPEDIAAYREVGFDDHMGKPFEIITLLSLINKYML